MLHHIALLSPPYASLTYASPEWLPPSLWRPGLRVAVPLGNGAVRVGVVLDSFHPDAVQESEALPHGIRIRPIVWCLEAEPLLSEEYLELVRQLAARQAITPGKILGSVLPQGLRTTARIRVREFREGGKPRLHLLRELARLTPGELTDLGQAFTQGRAEVLALKEDSAQGELCRLLADPPWNIRPNAVRQRQVLEYLLERGAISRRQLGNAVPHSAAALGALVKGGLVAIEPMSEDDEETDVQEALLPPPSPPFELVPEQRAALQAFQDALDAAQATGNSTTHLLFGITGSGKTAVYLELALACLARGVSALLLAPEVALALKLRRDVSRRFPDVPVHLFHGYQNPLLKEKIFRTVAATTSPCLIIGTRSALFLPLPPLGCIVLDEEHDASFKQDEGFAYQAKEVAWQRAARHGAVLVLGSATPDVKTFHAVRQGSLPMQTLTHRVGGGTLPAIDLVDIRNNSSGDLLAPHTVTAMKETVERGEQVVVLLNRRGYAPLMYCLDCGQVARCPHCDIGLTYHKRREQLVCHYCGHTRPFPSLCVHCKGLHYLPMGEGTERLEERLAGEQLAGVLAGGRRVLRLDRDSARRPGRMEEILAAFARHEAQVLVGTQMLSKGHHFPEVTLAVIADGDLGLNLPDYRAAERTFQLLVQSAGRAGRGQKPGRVLIQTRDTRHYCWEYVAAGDYQGFYEREIQMREKRRYPPFVKLALVRVSYPMDCKDGLELLNRFGALLREGGKHHEVQVLGPAPAPLARIQGKLRFQWLLKADQWQGIRQVYSRALQAGLPRTFPKDWRVALDLDPVNML